ncbi:hypothetical protein [Wielerella bovis]|uniref:hypothetical protein n=1 Tax=Wielerella bovis TaxID=2917790 RepID=UPI00201980CF|nr:hypothetical protein [Wielerella bovis]MCG7657554.1 hypothetical protein [Wielerella bovis]MCG7659775.1 hypothetical protein [Wielerella bovis]
MLPKHLLCVSTAILLLNACATATLWEKHDGSRQTQIITQEQSDVVLGFARVKTTSSQLPPNSLVMLGEQYVYVLQAAAAMDNSASPQVDLMAILNAKLSQAFELHTLGASGQPHHATRLNAFPVQLKADDAKRFQSAFCLNYPENKRLSATERWREQVELDKLGFRQIQTANGITRIRCMVVGGSLYTRPSSLKYDYRFQTALPVHLETTKYRTTRTGHAGTAWCALLTPFTAVVDIVTLPITVPLAIEAVKGMSRQ